jgi:hypothetical protein
MPRKRLDGRLRLTFRLAICLMLSAVVTVLLSGCAFSQLTASLQAEATSTLGQQQEKAKESAVKENVHTLYVAITTYSVDHNDAYPSELTKALLKSYVVNWPTNKPMKSGTGPGDYTYTTPDSTFKLVGRGSGGEVVITVP